MYISWHKPRVQVSGFFRKCSLNTRLKSSRILLSNHKQTEQSTSTPRVTTLSDHVMLLSNFSAEHRGLKQFLVTSLRMPQVLMYLFVVLLALSLPLELIQNVLCHFLPFPDYLHWNNVYNSFYLEK